jgi:hypothetical protein
MPSFQWQRNGGNIPGATSQDYTIVIADDQSSLTIVYTPDSGPALVSPPVFVTFPTPIFVDQPNFSTANFNVGQNVTVNFNSFATEYPTTVSVTHFTVDGVSFLGDLVSTGSAFTWNSTGYNVYGKDGLIELELTATNSGGSVVSSRINSTLRDVPAQMTAPVASVVSGKTVSVDINTTVDDGNAVISSFDIRYSTNQSTWTVVSNFVDNGVLELPSFSTQYFIQSRANNVVGNGAWSNSAAVTTNTATVTALSPVSLNINSEVSTSSLGAASINSVTYDTAGFIVDYTGTLSVDYDTAGFTLEVI